MTPEELDFILKNGEGYRTEFKERLSSSLAKELCAFANASGGTVFLGVSDDGKITGCTLDNSLKSNIQNLVANCQPPFSVDIRQEGNVALIEVFEAENKPVHCSEGLFLRQGANSQKLNRDQIIKFLSDEGLLHWDEQVFNDFDFDTLYSQKLLNTFLRKTGINTTLKPVDILSNLKLIKSRDGRNWFTNTGYLFFGQLPELAVSEMEITCALYKGTEKVHVLDRKDFGEDLISNIDNAVLFIMRNTRLRYEIKGVQRKDIPEVPEEAVRESIVNAVLHRDYMITGARVMIEIFDDRIEISNPGGLPKSLSPEEFGRKSVVRNPNIAAMLQRFGYIERMGTGIKRVNELCELNGNPKPRYEFTTFFTVIYDRESGTDPVPTQYRPSTGPVPDQVLRLLEILKEGEFSPVEIRNFLNLSHRQTFRKNYLHPALEDGLIERTIPDKPTSRNQRYRLTEKGRKLING